MIVLKHKEKEDDFYLINESDSECIRIFTEKRLDTKYESISSYILDSITNLVNYTPYLENEDYVVIQNNIIKIKNIDSLRLMQSYSDGYKYKINSLNKLSKLNSFDDIKINDFLYSSSNKLYHYILTDQDIDYIKTSEKLDELYQTDKFLFFLNGYYSAINDKSLYNRVFLQYKIKYVLSNIYIKTILESYFGKENVYCVQSKKYIIRFPEILLKNSLDQTHTIRDLFVQFDLDNRNDVYLKGIRSTLTELEYNQNYQHSHLPRSKYSWETFCLGSSTEIRKALVNIQTELNEDNFINFITCLNSYVRWESVEGGPHFRIGDLKNSSSNSSRLNNYNNDENIVDLYYKLINDDTINNKIIKINPDSSYELNRYLIESELGKYIKSHNKCYKSLDNRYISNSTNSNITYPKDKVILNFNNSPIILDVIKESELNLNNQVSHPNITNLVKIQLENNINEVLYEMTKNVVSTNNNINKKHKALVGN